MKINNTKFNKKGKKVTLTIKDENNISLLIETIVREQFSMLFSLRFILRCGIIDYIQDIRELGNSLTIDYLEIEGESFNFYPIELYKNPETLLPVLEIVINPDREKKIVVYNAYIDKISYQATHKIFTPFYNLDFEIPE